MKERHLKHIVVFLIVLVIAWIRVEREHRYLPEEDEGHVVVRVEGVPYVEDNRLKVKVRVLNTDIHELKGKVAFLTLYGAENLPSEEFKVWGRVRTKEGRVFISASYKDIEEIYAKKKSIRDIYVERMQERVNNEEVKSLILSYIFGEAQEVIPLEYQSAFWKTGLLHVLVVSGAHLTLIAVILSVFLPGRYGLIISLLGVSFYTLFLVPLDPPVLRAYIMILFAILIKLLYARPDYLSLLFLSGSLILLLFPEYIDSYSFWLSFVGTLYVILAIKDVDGIKAYFKSPLLYNVFISFWTSFFAFLGTNSIVSTFSLATPMSVILTPIVGLPFLPFTFYSVLELITFFSLPIFPLEIMGSFILKLVAFVSHFGFALKSYTSIPEVIIYNVLGATILYFAKDWYKALAVLPFMPFLLRFFL